jgi:hypothetical protein
LSSGPARVSDPRAVTNLFTASMAHLRRATPDGQEHARKQAREGEDQ